MKFNIIDNYNNISNAINLLQNMLKVSRLFVSLPVIQNLISDSDNVSYLSMGLGSKYSPFFIFMLSKPPYPTSSQLIVALNCHELFVQKMGDDETSIIDHNQAS